MELPLRPSASLGVWFFFLSIFQSDFSQLIMSSFLDLAMTDFLSKLYYSVFAHSNTFEHFLKLVSLFLSQESNLNTADTGCLHSPISKDWNLPSHRRIGLPSSQHLTLIWSGKANPSEGNFIGHSIRLVFIFPITRNVMESMISAGQVFSPFKRSDIRSSVWII